MSKSYKLFFLIFLLATFLLITLLLFFLPKSIKNNEGYKDSYVEKEDSSNKKITIEEQHYSTEDQIIITYEEDALDDIEPQVGEIVYSNKIKEFVNAGFSNNYYVNVSINLYKENSGYIMENDYVFQGKTIKEWKENPLIQQYNDLFGSFKESKIYINRTENCNIEELYKEFWILEQEDEEFIQSTLEAKEKLQQAINEYNSIKDNKLNELYNNECKRLNECGYDVRVIRKDAFIYSIIGKLNSNNIELFPIGNFGYTISLYFAEVPIDD